MTVVAGWMRRRCAAGVLWGVLAGVSAAGCRAANGNEGTATANAAAAVPDSSREAVRGAAMAEARKAGGAPLRVVFMGTSLTAGYGLESSEAFPALVQRKADSAGVPIVAVNAGVSGETSAGALRRVDWVLRDPVDVFVLETGANDGLRGQSMAELESNLTAIIGRVRAAHPAARVALVQMEALSNMGAPYTSGFHAVYGRVAKATGATLLPFLLEGVAGERALNQQDGVHPNEAGEQIVAANVWRAVRPVLEGAEAAGGRAAAR